MHTFPYPAVCCRSGRADQARYFVLIAHTHGMRARSVCWHAVERGVRPYATTQQVCACACSMHTFPYEPAGQTEGRRTHTRRAVQFPVPPSTLRRASANVAHDAMRNSTTRNTVRLHQISTDDRSQQCSAHSGYIDALCPLAPDYTWADEGRATDLLGSWWP